MQKNYYVILGINSDAGLEEIKAAFRRRAMELHPDRSGLESGPFLEAQEAYGVLSDPERRRDYDRRGLAGARRRPWGPSAEPLVSSHRRSEPFATPGGVREASLAESFQAHRPSFDELFQRLRSNFESIGRPKAETVQSLTVEILLSRDEARRGGRVRINVPARATCPACGGQGAVGPYECWRCAGQGARATVYPVEVEYLPGIQDSDAVRIPLARYGIGNFYLTVLFRTSSDW